MRRAAKGERRLRTRSPSTMTARFWGGFNNHYWPALYFIDAAGKLCDHHFGEGNYEQSENDHWTIAGSARGRQREGS